jgi:serine/threonine protein kinase
MDHYMDGTGSVWDEFLTAFNIESATLLRQSTDDPFRRVYLVRCYSCVYKIVALRYETSSHLREQYLAGEFSILEHCAGIPGVPSAIAHYKRGEFEVLVMDRLPGEPLADLHPSWLQLFIILTKLAVILVRLSWRGVSHNDILPTNVLVTSKAAVSLVDFDQASRNKFWVALVKQFTGINIGESKVSNSLVTIFTECLKKKLPPRIIQFLKRLCGCKGDEAIYALPALPDNAGFRRELIEAEHHFGVKRKSLTHR